MPRKKPARSKERQEMSGDESGASVRSRSRSRSRSPGWVSVTPTTKRERRALKRADKERKEKERERVLLKEKRTEQKTWAGCDRISRGTKELYVVCEDVRDEVRKIKKEAPDESARAADNGAGAEEPHVASAQAEATKTGKKRKIEDECATDVSPFEEMALVTRDLQRFVLADANKLTRWTAERILAQASRYEGILKRVVLENARLQGQLQASERMHAEVLREVCDTVCKVRDNVSQVTEGVGKVQETVARMDVGVRKVNAVCAGIKNVATSGASAPSGVGLKKSYAVIVRGEKESLTCAEVKKRMAEKVSESVDVRVRAVKPVRGGGIVVETVSDRERAALANCPGFARAGLRVEQPKRLDPRIVVYDVPCEVTEEQFMQGLYEKNVSDLMPAAEFRKRAKIVKRFAKEGKNVGNIIVELPMVCRERILSDSRLYVGWRSFKACAWERVPRCFACLGYGHRVKDCKSARLCWRCGKPGHDSASCKAPEDCSNCRARKLPSGHSAMSPKCPEYEWRLNVLRSRLSNE